MWLFAQALACATKHTYEKRQPSNCSTFASVSAKELISIIVNSSESRNRNAFLWSAAIIDMHISIDTFTRNEWHRMCYSLKSVTNSVQKGKYMRSKWSQRNWKCPIFEMNIYDATAFRLTFKNKFSVNCNVFILADSLHWRIKSQLVCSHCPPPSLSALASHSVTFSKIKCKTGDCNWVYVCINVKRL